DFEYEKTLYDINNSLENIETIILPARKELAYISSTFARDMIKFNRPLNGIVPPEAIEFIVKAL
ncbi:MAG: pantetheine-phosphate adenylyltransferase, partial [Clostridia bacterium]